jgi:hypothetical protein
LTARDTGISDSPKEMLAELMTQFRYAGVHEGKASYTAGKIGENTFHVQDCATASRQYTSRIHQRAAETGRPLLPIPVPIPLPIPVGRRPEEEEEEEEEEEA